MSIGNQIRKYRKESNISQKELGNRLGMSQQQIAQYENGNRMPKVETLQRIADALGIYIGKLDDKWGADILNNKEDYIKFRKQLSDYEADVQKKADREEQKLVENYWKLNKIGRKEAQKRVKELTEVPRYIYQEDSDQD
jgi:transcriptional regulator with XRE-family HTH domain